MWVIKVTSLGSNKPVYININQIGHFYEVEETEKYGRIDKPRHTRIGVTTHNNGGFEVKESVKEIAQLILNAGSTLENITDQP